MWHFWHSVWAWLTILSCCPQMYCQLFKSHLAVIESEREQNFVEGLLRREYHQGNTCKAALCVFTYQTWYKNPPCKSKKNIFFMCAHKSWRRFTRWLLDRWNWRPSRRGMDLDHQRKHHHLRVLSKVVSGRAQLQGHWRRLHGPPPSRELQLEWRELRSDEQLPLWSQVCKRLK